MQPTAGFRRYRGAVTNALRPEDPRRLGTYEILSRIGAGGMGTVFLARTAQSRLVAIKVIQPEHVSDDEFRARFRSEVTRARQVPPFCTAEVLDADPEHNPPYLVVEYVDGPDLAEVVRENGPLGAGALHSVAVGVATALAAIHGAGVVHRDLKPRNVLFALGNPKVIDFGIARAIEVTSRHTRTDMVVGTLAYMAPERLDPETDQLVGPPADVFAWGVVVAYAGTGRTPFAGDSPSVTAARILTQPPNLDGLPTGLAQLVRLALAKDPAQRPTAHELLDMLLKGDTGGFHPDLTPDLQRAAEAAQHSGRYHTDEKPRPAKTRRLPSIVAALAVTAVLAGAAAVALSHKNRPQPADMRPSAPSSVVRGPAVIDALDRYAQWSEDIDDSDGFGCTFDNRMIVTASPGTADYCLGPSAVFAGDQSVAVDMRLGTATSCAAIWIRAVNTRGYRVTLCPGRAELGVDFDGSVNPVASAQNTALVARRSHRVTLVLRGDFLAIDAGTTRILDATLSEPALLAGETRLGATAQDSADPSTVAYTNVELRSLPVPAPGDFMDLTAPNLDAVVRLRGIWDIDHAIALESATATKGSQTIVTLPLSPKARFFSPHFDDKTPQDCFDPKTHEATCPIQEEAFETWADMHEPALLKVRIRDGIVVRVAGIDN
jgi:serine/threonine protein kinase